MTKTIGMAAATFLAVCGAFAALGDTVEEREKRTDEIAQWLPVRSPRRWRSRATSSRIRASIRSGSSISTRRPRIFASSTGVPL